MGTLSQIHRGTPIRNHHRWPEARRVPGLQRVEPDAPGYTTPSLNRDAAGFEAHRSCVFHSRLSIQAGCHRNAVSMSQQTGPATCELFGHSIIVNPAVKIVAIATSWDDDLITAAVNIDMCTRGRTTIANFEKHRRPEADEPITQQVGAVRPQVCQKPDRR